MNLSLSIGNYVVIHREYTLTAAKTDIKKIKATVQAHCFLSTFTILALLQYLKSRCRYYIYVYLLLCIVRTCMWVHNSFLLKLRMRIAGLPPGLYLSTHENGLSHIYSFIYSI